MEDLLDCVCEKLSVLGRCVVVGDGIHAVAADSTIDVSIVEEKNMYVVSISVDGSERFRLVDGGDCSCVSKALELVYPMMDRKPAVSIAEILRRIEALRKAGVLPSEILKALVDDGVPEDIAIALLEAYIDFAD